MRAARDRSEYYKKWRSENKEKEQQRHRNEYLANQDKMKERTRLWRENNPEASKERIQKWRENNRDRVRESFRQWTALNKDRVAEAKRNASHLRRARKRSVPAEKINISDIYTRDGWICQICKKKVNKGLKWPHPLCASLDHIIPLSRGGGHTQNNVQLTHLVCNMKANAFGIKQTRLF